MQNTSSRYKELIKQSGRAFKVKVFCTFSDGTKQTFTDSDILQNGLKISTATSNEGSFDVGCAIIGELTLELDNSNKQLSDADFEGASFDVRVGLIVKQKYDGTTETEWIKKGIFYTEEVNENETYISITAFDAMAQFDKEYNTNLEFPQKLSAIFSDACNSCGVPYASLDFPNNDFSIESAEYIDESATYRDILSYVAQLACCFVSVDVDGLLHMRWYEETEREITERQKISGGVTVTCALITRIDDESQYIIGHSGYAVNIEDNPLAQGSVNTLSQAFTDNIIGKTVTPFSGEILSDPSIEAGDIVTIYDYSGNEYKTPITSIVFNIDSKMQLACDAETFNEKNRAGGSPSASIIAMAKKQTERQISEYDIRVQQMNSLATNAMGYYETIETQDDGSIICYMHDKESLSESIIIWKKTVDGIFVSSDGGETYSAGVDKNGNAVLKVLAAEGIIADWISAGTLKGIEIIAETGEIAGWKISGNTLVSSDGSFNIDSDSNTITVNGSDGTKLMSINSGGIKFWRDSTEIGQIGIRGGDSGEYGLTFDLVDGDAMTWNVYNSSDKKYVNKLRYTEDNGLVVHNALTASSVSAGNGASGTIPIITKIENNSEGGITWTSSSITVENGIITAIPKT